MTGLAERDGSVAEPLAQVAPARSALAAWAKPLRVHLSVVIVALLIAISAPLMWLTYSQGTREAIDAAESQMRLLSQQATSLYEAMLSDGPRSSRWPLCCPRWPPSRLPSSMPRRPS